MYIWVGWSPVLPRSTARCIFLLCFPNNPKACVPSRALRCSCRFCKLIPQISNFVSSSSTNNLERSHWHESNYRNWEPRFKEEQNNNGVHKYRVGCPLKTIENHNSHCCHTLTQSYVLPTWLRTIHCRKYSRWSKFLTYICNFATMTSLAQPALAWAWAWRRRWGLSRCSGNNLGRLSQKLFFALEC